MPDLKMAEDASPVMSQYSYQRLRVRAVIEETHDSRSIIFEEPVQAEKFTYRPGQFLTLRIPTGDADRPHVARCYSLASAAALGEPLKVTVKRVEGGLGSNWLCDSLEPGDELEVLPPAGHFCPRSLEGSFLLFAGGSGITPVMSILKAVLNEGSGRIALIYANRDERSVIFARELDELARRYAQRLTIHHWLESVQGLPSPELLAGLAKEYTAFEAYICGPEKYMECATAALASLGMDRGRIHVERFISLTDDPGVKKPVQVQPDDDDQAPPADLSVRLDGDVRSLTWSNSITLLDTLLAAGIDAPFSCREGKCSACICKLREGMVTMAFNGVLDTADLEEGWILACQASPASQYVDVSFDD